MALITGDKVVLHLQANDIAMAVLTYVGMHEVFDIKFDGKHVQWFGFLQRVFLNVNFREEDMSKGHEELLKDFIKESQKIKEMKQFKSHCV